MDGTYAPQSPDLSSFLSSPSKQQQSKKQQPQPLPPQAYHTTSQSTSYAPRSPVIPSFNTQPQHHNIAHQFQQHNPQQQFGLGLGGENEFSEYGNAPYMPLIPALPPAHSSFGAPANSPYFNNAQRNIKNEDLYDYRPPFDGVNDDYTPSPAMSSAPRGRGRPPNTMASASFAAPPQQQHVYKNPNPNNIEIKTKFPVARIKRIMQADEEVGKVAQVTPVALSKALELFMIALVSGAAEKAKEKGGKRVTAQHLKMVVEGDEQFDFLSEIVGKVADVQEGAGGSKRKEKMEGSDSEEEKKVKKGKGRRKKSDD